MATATCASAPETEAPINMRLGLLLAACDVRPRGRHVPDERVDLGGGDRPRHDGERRSVGDRPRGAGLGGLHPDQQQDRRPASVARRPTSWALLGYAVGAPGDGPRPGACRAIIIFWAIIGGLGASLLLPAMQSLIHGNFEGAAQKRVYALVGRPPRSRPPSARWSAGFITTFLSWRVGFAARAGHHRGRPVAASGS